MFLQKLTFMSWTLLIEAGPPNIDFIMMGNKLLIFTLPKGKRGFLDLLLPFGRLHQLLSWHPDKKMVTRSNISRFILLAGYLISVQYQKKNSMSCEIKSGLGVWVLQPWRLERSKASFLECMFLEVVELCHLDKLIEKFLVWSD